MTHTRLGTITLACLTLATLLLLAPRAAADCGGQTLGAVSAAPESVNSASAWVNVGAGVTISRAGASAANVLVIASFETSNGSTVGSINELRLVDNAAPQRATQAIHQSSVSQRNGIGSAIGLFHAPAGESRTYNLQHRASGGSLATRGTLAALPLVTSAGHALAHAIAVQQTSFESGFDGAGAYVLVPATAVELTLARAGDVYLVASLDARYGTGLSPRTGEWRLLWRAWGADAWQPAGIRGLHRLLNETERHIVSLTTLLEELPAGRYEFALGFRREDGAANIITSGATLAAVSLGFGGGSAGAGRFPAFQITGSHSTNSTSFVDALATPVSLAVGEQLYIGAQYAVRTSAATATDGRYRLAAGGSRQTPAQTRYLTGDLARSSGASVWLWAAPTAGNHPVALQHRSVSSSISMTLDGALVGIQLTAVCEAPNSVVMGSFTARSTPAGVLLGWRADPQFGGVAFHLERGGSSEGPYAPLDVIVADPGCDGSYWWVDRDAAPGVRYYYRVESIGALGGASIEFTSVQHWPFHAHLPLAGWRLP